MSIGFIIFAQKCELYLDQKTDEFQDKFYQIYLKEMYLKCYSLCQWEVYKTNYTTVINKQVDQNILIKIN